MEENKSGRTGISGMNLDNSSIENVSIIRKNSDEGDVGIFDTNMKNSKISDAIITDEKDNDVSTVDDENIEKPKSKFKTILKSVGVFLFDNVVKIVVGILIVFLCVMLGLKK